MTDTPNILGTIAALVRRTSHDAVTSLPNRRQMQEKLHDAVARAQRAGERLSILVVDIDFFRNVIAEVGQTGADQLLGCTAARVVECAGVHFVARTGDNEFTIFLENEEPDAVLTIASKILDALREPFEIDDREVCVTASIGIGDLSRDGKSSDVLQRVASAALGRAKELGGNQCQHSSAALMQAEYERRHIADRVRDAIAAGEFALHYQPQVRLSDGAVVGAEALLRWNREGRTVASSAFIGGIEETAVVIELGEWVIAEACRQLAMWRLEGVAIPRVAINVGRRHFQHPRLAETISTLLEKHGLRGSDLELEITEATAMHDAEATVRTLHDLRALGIEITIDDFGSGYSSLAYLKRFAITGLKVDRALVANVPGSRSAATIVIAIVATAHALELRVVAEGVETAEQARFLTAISCDHGQGRLFARPIPPENVPEFV